MTPAEIELVARNRYNAIGDTFWSQAEILGMIYAAQMDLALKTNCIRNVYSMTTTIGLDEYSMPTTATNIRRIEYDSRKLEPISDRERDDILGGKDPTLVTGRPTSYYLFGESIFLVKTPDSALTVKIWSFDIPSVVTLASTLDVPSRYHPYIAEFILAKMYAKDKRFDQSQYHLDIWDAHIKDALKIEFMRAFTDTTRNWQGTQYNSTFGREG